MLEKLQVRLEAARAMKNEKKGASALETIIIAGILIAVTVGIIGMLARTVNSGGIEANNAIRDAIGLPEESA